MNYIYNYSLGSVFFGALTIIFYYRQKRLHDLQDRLFSLMLLCSFFACIFDAAAAASNPIGMRFPLWSLYLINILFLLPLQTCLPCVWMYAVNAAGKLGSFTYRQRALITAPYFLAVLCILLSPLSRFGVFYIDAQHFYQNGVTHALLYVNTCFYMVLTTYTLMSNFKTVQRQKRIVIFIFSGLVFLSVVLQIIFPRYLLTTTAAMLAVTAMFYIVQSPEEQREPLTGAFSRMLLQPLLQSYHERGADYTLLLFIIRGFDQISNVYGAEVGDAVLRQISTDLQARFERDAVVYMDTAEFTVACHRVLSEKEIRAIYARLPRSIVTEKEGYKIPVNLGMAAVIHDDKETAHTVLMATEFLYQRLRTCENDDLLLADAAFQVDCTRRNNLESNVDRILTDGVPALTFDPILLWGRTPCGADALLKINHAATEGVTPWELYTVSAQSGCAWQYFSMCLRAAAPFVTQFRANRRINFPLSSFLYISAESPARILDMVEAAGFSPAQIGFYVPEAEIASAPAPALGNILRLSEMGFAFRLDDFAQGFTDISLLTVFPGAFVRIGGALFDKAARDVRQLKLLRGTVNLLRSVGIEVICGEIDSTEDAAVAAAADITMIQGAFIRSVSNFPRG